ALPSRRSREPGPRTPMTMSGRRSRDLSHTCTESSVRRRSSTHRAPAPAHDAAIKAAFDGDLRRLRGTVKSLDDPRVIFSFGMGGGIGVLHIAAVGGHLEVCKYLVEELGGDVNAPAPGVGDFAGVTPFMSSAQSGDVSTVKYLLDHGGDLTKSDAKGRTVLHHAACIA
uniref:Uncharacterized protein n=1 Tax=Aegilops tauschii subsp. strangulata TaxID=200361 RepID=A0A453DFL7_AEGTS